MWEQVGGGGLATSPGMRRPQFYPSSALVSKLLWTLLLGLHVIICEIKMISSRSLILITILMTFVPVAEFILCARYQAGHLPTLSDLILMATLQKDSFHFTDDKTECARSQQASGGLNPGFSGSKFTSLAQALRGNTEIFLR